MQLAKSAIDFGLFTNNLESMLDFWQGDVGLRFDQVLPLRRGVKQYRHNALNSVVKINHNVAPLAVAPPSGYRELIIAQHQCKESKHLSDPDGNRVLLVPFGDSGIRQIGIRISVRNIEAHRQFYGHALGLPEEACQTGAAFRAGESLLILEQNPEAGTDPGFEGLGWRYITFQVFKVDDIHATIIASGGREAMAPVTLGTTARISMVLDPDGNWIELSQRASIVGTLS